MSASTLALVIVTPFLAIFAYATWHEYKRYKAEGPNSYGLTYDPETNTTVVGAVAEDEESYDPADFVPDLPESEAAAEDDAKDETATAPDTRDGPDTGSETDHPDADDSNKDRRT